MIELLEDWTYRTGTFPAGTLFVLDVASKNGTFYKFVTPDDIEGRIFIDHGIVPGEKHD